jgi:Tfp pilus assembly PilM family ATPase
VPSIGIDIGIGSVKVAVLDGTPKAPRLLAFHQHRLEGEKTTRSLGPEDMADLLRSLMESWRVPSGTVVAAASAASALARELTVPFTRDDQIRKTIKFQAESVFHAVSIDDLVVDFYKLAEYGGERSRLLCIGVRKELLKERLSALEMAERDPSAVDLDAAALYTTCTLAPAAAEGKRILAVDLGGSTMKMVAVEAGQLRGLRSTRLQGGSIKVGEKKPEKKKRASVDDLESALSTASREDTFFTEQDEGRLPVVILDEEQTEIFDFLDAGEEERRDVLEKVFLEIDRTLAAVRLDGPIDQIYLTGGGAAVEGIEKAFGDHFGAPCGRLSVQQAVPAAGRLPRDAAGDLDLFGAVAVGLALKGIGHDPAGLDFRKEEFQYAGKFDKAKRGLACALVLLFVLFFTIAYSYRVIEMERLMRKQDRIFQYQEEIYATLFPEERGRIPSDVKLALSKKKSELERKLKGFQVDDVHSALDMLRDLSQGFEESGKKCLLKELTLKQKSSSMRVEVENELVTYDLKQAVNNKPRLVEIEEGRVSPAGKDSTAISCEFRIKVREPEKKKGPPLPARPEE